METPTEHAARIRAEVARVEAQLRLLPPGSDAWVAACHDVKRLRHLAAAAHKEGERPAWWE